MQNIINKDLSFSPYHEKIQATQTIKRLQRCKKLLNRHGSESVGRIFSDENLLCIEYSYNANDVCLPTFGNIPETLRIVKYFQNKYFVMVWAAMSRSGKLPEKFIDKGVEFNAECCKQETLAMHCHMLTDYIPKRIGCFNKYMFLHHRTDPKSTNVAPCQLPVVYQTRRLATLFAGF